MLDLLKTLASIWATVLVRSWAVPDHVDESLLMMPCRIVARWTSVAFISVVAQDPPEGGSERRERPALGGLTTPPAGKSRR